MWKVMSNFAFNITDRSHTNLTEINVKKVHANKGTFKSMSPAYAARVVVQKSDEV